MPIPILSPLSRPKLLGKEIQIFYDKWIKMDGQTGGCVLLWHKAQSALRLNIANALIRVRKAHPRLFCAPGTIRTSDLLVRSQLLYPAELRAHVELHKVERLQARVPGWGRARVKAMPIS